VTERHDIALGPCVSDEFLNIHRARGIKRREHDVGVGDLHIRANVLGRLPEPEIEPLTGGGVDISDTKVDEPAKR
jgi:hypothetical protein